MAPASSSKGPSDTNTHHTGEQLQIPHTSLFPAPASRPRSILNVSRSAALTPSLSSHTPLHQLSTSPSNASFVSNQGTRGGLGATTHGALNRLKRVASSASIASSSKIQQQSSHPQSAVDKKTISVAEENTDEADASLPASLNANGDHNDLKPSTPLMGDTDNDTLAPPKLERTQRKNSESSVNSTTKRPRSPPINLGDAATQKQARRKTWFGFGGYVDPAGDTEMADDSPEDKGKGKGKETTAGEAATSIQQVAPVDTADVTPAGGDTRMQDVEQKKVPLGVADGQAIDSKGWLTWRAPSAPSEAQAATAASPATYTDTVKRYISATSTQGASWIGWPGWHVEQKDRVVSGDESKKTEDRIAGVEAEPEENKDENANQQQTTAQTRWWPLWGSHQEPQVNTVEEARPPPTPAEQVKAEALARLEAKDAVLNNATRSTWINYFSSRSALPPSRLEDQDRGPEVMKIDFPVDKSNGIERNVNDKGQIAKPISREPSVKPTVANNNNEQKKGEKINPKADPAPPISRPSTPLTTDKERAKEVTKAAAKAAPKGKKGDGKPPKGPPPRNLLLPSFEDTFNTAPRIMPPSKGVIEKTLSYLFNRSGDELTRNRMRKPSLLSIGSSRGAEDDQREHESQTRLPRLFSVVNDKERAASRGCKGVHKVTIIGIHGWFSQGPLRNLFGEPTGTSIKFATMMSNAVKGHFEQAGQSLSDEQLSMIALEADGLVADRVNKSFSALLNNQQWLSDILSSNVVFIASHSQGSVVATHLLARLIEQRHLDPKRTKVVLLAMCGIHHGPFTHLRSSVATYYLNTFETPAAKELFEFQNSKSPVSMMYAAALRIVINAGVKLVYIASMDDQVVPLYSALNSSASHPSILRAIFCDGAVFPRIDFLTNLLSFCAAVRNAGLSDHNLLTLLSASVAGSLYGGAGHSIVYEEPQVYTLAVRYLMEVTSPTSYPTTKQSDLQIPSLYLESFSTADNAKWNSNPFALPWSLRGLLEDEVVRRYFEPVIEKLLSDYNEWTPTTKTLKDVQFRLEPMRLVSRQPTPSISTATSTSKL